MAPHGALGRGAKHLAKIELRSPSLYFGQFGPHFLCLCSGAQSLIIPYAGPHPSPEKIGIFPLAQVPYPWDSSSSLNLWAPAEEAELIEEEQEVWCGESVTDLVEDDLVWMV